jgi:hypothetical protein
MHCGECDREHVITGQILVDGVALHPGLIETMIEIGCAHDLLRPRLSEPDPEFLVEPEP